MSESDRKTTKETGAPRDVESLLRQRDELDRVIREQFQRRVAVIFTDIQGSTQYFERYGDLAGRAMVQRHNDLLFPVVANSGGRVVKTIGDAIMAFFENAHTAVDAAIKMQRALDEKNAEWPERERIFVRIGVHVGEALVDSADVYGDTVNTAARIEAQANGGEIMISDAVLAELGASAPPTRARGGVKLKGKAHEVPLFEVRWREREPAFAAAVAGVSRGGKGKWVALGSLAVLALGGGTLFVADHGHFGRMLAPSAPAPSQAAPTPTPKAVPAPVAEVKPPPAAPVPPPAQSTQLPAPSTPPVKTAEAPPPKPAPTPAVAKSAERPSVHPAHHVAARPEHSGSTGKVHVHVFPFGDVVVDGKLISAGTRDAEFSLPVGSHELRVHNKSFPDKTLRLEVTSGGVLDEDVSLTPGG